ncbi:hypothetical protein JNM87_00865 [Candidatus Saccharibacteria bacterium]|nr:hypothetical protein [Candidatus Saccharibacteria bacterium]
MPPKKRHLPQVRIPKQQLPAHNAEIEPFSPDLETLTELFCPEDTSKASTFFTSMHLGTLSGYEETSSGEHQDDDAEVDLTLVVTAKRIFMGLDLLKSVGFDFVEDPTAYTGASKNKKLSLIQMGNQWETKVTNAYDKTRTEHAEGELEKAAAIVAANALIVVFKANSNLYDRMRSEARDSIAQADEHSATGRFLTDWIALATKASLKPSSYRRDTHRLLTRLDTPQMRAFVDAEIEAYVGLTQKPYTAPATAQRRSRGAVLV